MATALNPDIYAHLLTFISSPADVLAVALTSSDLFHLGMPELRCRSIRTYLGDNTLWRYLAENPTLASRVRELVILQDNALGLLEVGRVFFPDLRSAVPSRRMIEAGGEKSERLLIQALRVLVNLESFGWHQHQDPLINEGQKVPLSFGLQSSTSSDAPPEVYSEDVWTVLRKHTQVKKLIVINIVQRQMIPANVFDSSVRVPISLFCVYKNNAGRCIPFETSHM